MGHDEDTREKIQFYVFILIINAIITIVTMSIKQTLDKPEIMKAVKKENNIN